eukprot:c14052_g2_i2 orf=71-373(-)
MISPAAPCSVDFAAASNINAGRINPLQQPSFISGPSLRSCNYSFNHLTDSNACKDFSSSSESSSGPPQIMQQPRLISQGTEFEVDQSLTNFFYDWDYMPN